jgi:hypothetical protein
MQQVKVFIGLEGQTVDLENEVNTWIRESGAKIVSITGNISPQAILPEKATTAAGLGGTGGLSRRFAPSDVMILVVYEAK